MNTITLIFIRGTFSESQRAMVAAKLANMPRGGDDYRTANLQTDTATRAEAAELLNVSERSVNTAKSVQRTGDESLQQAVTQGEVSLHAASDIATLPK